MAKLSSFFFVNFREKGGGMEQFVASKGNEVKLKDLVKKGKLEEIAIGEDPKR